MRMAFGCALPLGGAREAGEEALPRNADEFGRMKGEEVARGPIVQALYQARLRTLLFSLRGCFAFWPPSWEWAGGMDQKGARWKESGVLDSGGDHGGSL